MLRDCGRHQLTTPVNVAMPCPLPPLASGRANLSSLQIINSLANEAAVQQLGGRCVDSAACNDNSNHNSMAQTQSGGQENYSCLTDNNNMSVANTAIFSPRDVDDHIHQNLNIVYNG